MGYTTDFSGQFDLNKPLSEEHHEYLKKFSYTRRMMRSAEKAAAFPDPVREAVGLPIGEQGEYYVGSDKDFGQTRDDSIVNYNSPPESQPGLWCKWTPNEQGTAIEWSGAEKFYSYVEWLEYLIQHFLKPWGYKLNGEVTWQGEESSDMGKIVVKNNKVTTLNARVVYE